MILGRMAAPFKRIKISIVVKLSALVAGSVVVTALAVNEVYMRGSNQLLIDRSIEGLQEEAGYFQAPLQGIIDALKDDVQLLAHTHAADGIVRASQHRDRKSTRLNSSHTVIYTFPYTTLFRSYFQAPLQGIIDALKDDVQLLAHTHAPDGIVRASQHGGIDPDDGSSTTAELKRRLATTFTEMLRTRERYRRIRFIDA